MAPGVISVIGFGDGRHLVFGYDGAAEHMLVASRGAALLSRSLVGVIYGGGKQRKYCNPDLFLVRGEFGHIRDSLAPGV